MFWFAAGTRIKPRFRRARQRRRWQAMSGPSSRSVRATTWYSICPAPPPPPHSHRSSSAHSRAFRTRTRGNTRVRRGPACPPLEAARARSLAGLAWGRACASASVASGSCSTVLCLLSPSLPPRPPLPAEIHQVREIRISIYSY